MKQILLSGPPGVGKTVVGTAAARHLGVSALDLDEQIEQRTLKTPATIIRAEGEDHFREIETETLISLEEGALISLGGGTLTTRKGRTVARSRGTLLGLEAGKESLCRRLSGGDRPLLDGGLDQLLEHRHVTYRAVDKRVPAEEDVETVARHVVASASNLHLVHASFENEQTRVLIGQGLADAATGAVANATPTRPVLAIVDLGISASHRQRYLDRMCELFDVSVVEVEGGEQVKTWDVLGNLLEHAIEAGCGRQSVVVGMGGGATCDLAALAASLLGRGAPLVLIPSTLLAQVDAAIGGKCAVNVGGRNLVGAFHVASDVIADVDLLETLDEGEYRSGRAELLKMSVIADPDLFGRVVEQQSCQPQDIARAVQHKARIVESDPREKSERKLLNFGHTLGHALEVGSGFSLRHGESVAIGMAAAARFSRHNGWTTPEQCDRLLKGIRALGLATGATSELLERSRPYISSDKKSDIDTVDFVRFEEVGKVSLKRLSLKEVQRGLVRFGGD